MPDLPPPRAPKNHVDCSREKREKVEEEKREEKLVFASIKSSVGDFNNKIPYSCRHTNRTQAEEEAAGPLPKSSDLLPFKMLS